MNFYQCLWQILTWDFRFPTLIPSKNICCNQYPRPSFVQRTGLSQVNTSIQFVRGFCLVVIDLAERTCPELTRCIYMAERTERHPAEETDEGLLMNTGERHIHHRHPRRCTSTDHVQLRSTSVPLFVSQQFAAFLLFLTQSPCPKCSSFRFLTLSVSHFVVSFTPSGDFKAIWVQTEKKDWMILRECILIYPSVYMFVSAQPLSLLPDNDLSVYMYVVIILESEPWQLSN